MTDPLAGKQWAIEPLTAEHELEGFTSGAPSVDRYLREAAKRAAEYDSAATRVLVEEGQLVVRGYFTLVSSEVELAHVPVSGRAAKKAKLREEVPVTLLAQIGLAEDLQGGELGHLLLTTALRVAVDASGQVGSFAVVLDALNEPLAEKIYEPLGFRHMHDPGRPLRLFITMREARELVADR